MIIPPKTLGAESLVGFPGQKHCTHFAAFSLLGEECDLSWEGKSIRKHMDSSRLSPVSFFFFNPAVS